MNGSWLVVTPPPKTRPVLASSDTTPENASSSDTTLLLSLILTALRAYRRNVLIHNGRGRCVFRESLLTEAA
ncbi:CLUMA_CG021637, isoform A [Clunio marinus]|uniref:CLUMA_CG021637, isoform A n=1 Tax=Clunio marinus TaxID=568069 RepID=A0A1J1J801_9DIPT|nr:CLUMA_CG021637, isoform A [Clunio marinus]